MLSFFCNSIVGNPQICATEVKQNCFRTTLISSVMNNNSQGNHGFVVLLQTHDVFI
jgi:hypothetical protein